METERVSVLVNVGKGMAHFMEGCRPQAGQRDEAIRAQRAVGFAQGRGQIAPLDSEAGPVKIQAGIGERQMLQVAGNATTGSRDPVEHGGRQVKPDGMGVRKARLQVRLGKAGAAPGIEDAGRCDIRQACRELRANAALDVGRAVIGRGGPLE